LNASGERRGYVVWLTGLPCSGKSTLATALAQHLEARGVRSEVLDGDVVRRHLSKGLGFSREDRDTNVRRIGFVAGLLARNGVPVIVAAVSPYRSTRAEVRSEIANFVEVHVQCPQEVCERRDVKGMYAQARAGKIQHFTGVDDPYEPPAECEVTIMTDQEDAHASLEKIVAKLQSLGLMKANGG
jgi:adenylyl-sulfate kinase